MNRVEQKPEGYVRRRAAGIFKKKFSFSHHQEAPSGQNI